MDDPPPPMEDDLSPLKIHPERARRLNIRTDSIVPTAGREGADIERLLYQGRSMAVFTSGGDSQGLFNMKFDCI